MKGWSTATLGDVCDIYQPKTISKKEMAPGGKYPVFGANGIIGRYDQYNHEEPQLLITCRGATCGSVNVSQPQSWITGNAMVIRPTTDDLDRRFVEYFFRGGIDISLIVTGAAQPQITRTSLAPVPIAYPPLPEQERIVAILDEAFAAIATATANAEKNLANAREIFESHLQSVFTHRGKGWVEKPFEELIESNVIGLTKASRHQGEDKAWPYVKMNNITRDNRFDFSRFTCVEATDEEVSKFSLRDGDFLFNTRNSYELVGKSCLYQSDSNDAVLFNNNIMRVRFKTGIDARFVLLAFSSEGVADELIALKSGTTNVSAIYFKDLKSLIIPVPPITTQETIAEKLHGLSEEIQRLARLYERKLAALEALKKSILHKAFTGELTKNPKNVFGCPPPTVAVG